MPGIVVPGVVQFTLLGTMAGHAVDNVVAIDIDTDISESRNEAIVDQAEVLNNAFFGNIGQYMSTTYTFLGCRWVDLDNEDGGVGQSTNMGALGHAPDNGSATADALPANVAILIRKVAGGGRRARNGRLYIGAPTGGHVTREHLMTHH